MSGWACVILRLPISYCLFIYGVCWVSRLMFLVVKRYILCLYNSFYNVFECILYILRSKKLCLSFVIALSFQYLCGRYDAVRQSQSW